MNQHPTSPALENELSQLSRLLANSLEVMSLSSRLSLLEHQFLILKDQILASTSALERRLSSLEAHNSNPAAHASSDSDPKNSEVNPDLDPPIAPDEIQCQIQQLLKLLQTLNLEQNSGIDNPLNKDEEHPSETKNNGVAGHNDCSTDPATPVESLNGASSDSSAAKANSASESDGHLPDQDRPNSVAVTSQSNSSVTSEVTADAPTSETTQWLTPAKAYEMAKQCGYPFSKTAFCLIAEHKNAKEKYARYGLGCAPSKRGSRGVQIAWFYLLGTADSDGN
jgi:hypothetical protein